MSIAKITDTSSAYAGTGDDRTALREDDRVPGLWSQAQRGDRDPSPLSLKSCCQLHTSFPLDKMAEQVVPRVPVIRTSCGMIQFGIPPETTKRNLLELKEVPPFYVLPDPIVRNGINFGDIEFPIYYYSFKEGWIFKGKKIALIATPEQIERLIVILQETIFGPKKESLAAAGIGEDEIARIERETHYFLVKNSIDGTPYKLEDFVQFIPFNTEGIAYLDEAKTLSVRRAGSDRFIVCDKDKEIPVEFKEKELQAPNKFALPQEKFVPPVFGVTFLGTSSGFDPEGLTTSFILWMNKRGLLIDPLAYIDKYLTVMGILPQMVPDVLLTHVHGDHDAGLIQYILLSPNKLRLYTTRVIFESFLRKAKAITREDFRDNVEFIELLPNQKTEYEKVFTIRPRNNFHSIPTIGFLVNSPFGSLFYSGDTFFDQEKLDHLVGEKILTVERKAELQVFQADIVFHEQGIFPLHTPLKPLMLEAANRVNKIILVHTSQPKQGNDHGMPVARTGAHYAFVEEK